MMQQPLQIDIEEEKHLDLGIYEENGHNAHKINETDNYRLRKSLQALDAIVENELRESEKWNKEMYKDFENPTCPTTKELVEKSIKTLEDITRLKESLVSYYKEEKMKKLLSDLFQTLGKVTRQAGMLSEVINCSGSHEEISRIYNKYDDLKESRLNINSRSQICWKTLSNCLDYLLKMLLLDLHRTVRHLFEKMGKSNDDNKINEIQIINEKMKVVSEYFPLAATFDKSDIFAMNSDDPYLKDLKKFIKTKSLGSSESVKKSFQKFIKSVQVGVSMMSKGSEMDSMIARKLTVSIGAVYYFICSEEAHKQTNLFYSQATEKNAFQTWNMLEDEFMANMMKITLPSIKYAKKTYVSRMFEPLTLDYINDALKSNTLGTLAPLQTRPLPLARQIELLMVTTRDPSSSQTNTKIPDKIPILVMSNKNLCPRKVTEIEITRKQNSNKTAATTEVVAEKHIENPKPVGNKEEKSENKMFCGLVQICKSLGCFPNDDIDGLDPYFDGLIIHIHGGGFVSMSASSHQSYTRQWSKILEKPVLSIDYRLAPEHPYPAAIDDCWQAYNWIVQNVETVLGIKPSRIILTGDSAGGNLALGVTALAIKNGIRPPDGLFLAYPALRLENKFYTPSLMLSLEDQVVPYSLLKLCTKSYVPTGADPSQDCLLSPIHYSEEILKRLPPVRMMVGEYDPLHDDCWRFTDKLRKLDKDVVLTVYKDMYHGFLGYDVPMGMPESKKCIQDSAVMISELLHTGK